MYMRTINLLIYIKIEWQAINRCYNLIFLKKKKQYYPSLYLKSYGIQQFKRYICFCTDYAVTKICNTMRTDVE